MSHQAGIENVVATSGTALTPFQLKILKRYSENLILGFDMDVAGDTATKRGIDLAQSFGFNIKVIRLPEGKDAADLISKNPKEWLESLEAPKSILDFYFESAFSGRDSKTPEGKKEISKILLKVIKRIPNQIERGHWIQKLANGLSAKEENIEEELKKVKLDEEIYGLEPEEKLSLPPKTRQELLEERFITLLLISKSPESLEFINDKELSCLTPKMQEIFKKIKENLADGREFDVIGLSPEWADLINYCYLKAEIEEVAETSSHLPPRLASPRSAIEEKDILPEIQYCLKEIQRLGVKNKLDQISQEIKKAEEEKDSKKIEKLTQEFSQLAKEIGR